MSGVIGRAEGTPQADGGHMEVRVGYKQTAVGVIPEDWAVEDIAACAESASGTTPARAAAERYFQGGTIPWVKTLDLNNSVIKETDECVTETALRETSLKLYPAGSVLVAMYGGFAQIGRTGYLPFPATINQALTAICPIGGKLDSKYLIYFLNHHVGYWKSVASSSRKDPNITGNDVRKFPISLPPTQEQCAIATALSDVDALLDGLTRLIAKKRDLKQATMQQLLTGQTRLPGFSGEWQKKTVAELEKLRLVQLFRGQVISKKDIENTPGDFPIYSSSVHNDGLFGRYGKFMFDEELITWSVDGGGNFFHRPKHKFSVTNVCGFMRVDTSRISYLFLAAELQLLHGRKRFDYQSKAHPSVVRNEYEVQLPPLEEQTAIAAVLTDMDAELAALKARLAKTRALKQAMMSELLTGKTRLPTE